MTRMEVPEPLSSTMSDLVNEWGITAVTTALIQKIESNANRLMETLLREKSFGLGYWILFYEPTPETYCFEQGCESDPENCGYFPRQCIETKYGTVKTDGN